MPESPGRFLRGAVESSGHGDSAGTRAIRALNARIKGDDRVHLAMLPVADGLTLALKR